MRASLLTTVDKQESQTPPPRTSLIKHGFNNLTTRSLSSILLSVDSICIYTIDKYAGSMVNIKCVAKKGDAGIHTHTVQHILYRMMIIKPWNHPVYSSYISALLFTNDILLSCSCQGGGGGGCSVRPLQHECCWHVTQRLKEELSTSQMEIPQRDSVMFDRLPKSKLTAGRMILFKQRTSGGCQG